MHLDIQQLQSDLTNKTHAQFLKSAELFDNIAFLSAARKTSCWSTWLLISEKTSVSLWTRVAYIRTTFIEKSENITR